MSILLIGYQEITTAKGKKRAWSDMSVYSEGKKSLEQMIKQAERVIRTAHNRAHLMQLLEQGDFHYQS